MAVRSDKTLNHMGTTNYDALFSEMMKDPEVRNEYDTLEAEFQLVRAMIKARYDAGLTQKELAAKTGIQQANISRIENGNDNPSISTLYKLAEGMGKKLVISFI